MKTLLQWLGLLLLMAGAFAYAMFQGGFVSWFLFSVMAALGLYEVLTTLLSAQPVGMDWAIKSRHLEAGADLQVQLQLKRRFYFPVAWLVIEAVLAKGDKKRERRKVMHYVWSRRFLSVRFRWDNLERGRYHLQPAVLTEGDLFGFFEREKRQKGHSVEIIVQPRLYPVYGWTNVSDEGDGAGMGRQTALQTTAVSGVRPYVPGDRLNQIHWKQSARGTGLKSKMSEGDSLQGIHFFLLQDPSIYGSEALFEWAVEVTASLVAAAQRRQKQVFLHLQNERFAVARQESLMEVLAGVQLMERGGEPNPFWERDSAVSDSSVVIVSPRITASVRVTITKWEGYHRIEWINVGEAELTAENEHLSRSGVLVSLARKESGGIRIMTGG